jgi:sugar phosphate isomerase/epimerase
MHAPAGRYILAAVDEEWRRESVSVLKEYVRLAGALGLTELVIHPIPSPSLVPDIGDPALHQRMHDAVRRSLDDLMPTIEESATRVTIENLPYLSDLPLRTMKELRAVVDGYPSEALGLVIDTGHVGVLELDPVEELHAAGERLCGTHIHDIDVREGRIDHHSPTLGNLDWTAMRQAFTDIGYTGPWTSEATKPSHGESSEELAREVREWMGSWV